MCETHKDRADNDKIAQIIIEFRGKYPEAMFEELPPDWTMYEFNRVKDKQIIEPKLTGLSCVCEHPPNESGSESIEFTKEVTISNLELWLANLDELACKAIQTLSGCN